MAEDPRFLLHFKTLSKFEEKLTDGTISANRHLCFIKDEKLVWCRGTYYSDNKRAESLIEYYNGWSITQDNASTLTITLTGKKWNALTRVWDSISKPLTIASATTSVAGLMSAADKLRLDNIKTNNLNSQTFAANNSNVIVTTINDAGTAGTTSTTSNFPLCSQSLAGVVSASDKQKIDGALLRSGGNLTGNVTANTGVTISASGFFQTSDKRKKTNIKPLLKTDEIDLVEYNWITSGKRGYGVVAQDVEVRYPELVDTDSDGTKKVDYIGLLCIKSAHLEHENKELKVRINNLEQIIKQLVELAPDLSK